MKNLGKIENKKDIATLSNIIEIPYGGIITVPKHVSIPDGYIEWGTTLKAEDYPHLVDIFGTTNIILKPVEISMTSNNSSSELYIETTNDETGYNCDETFNNLWKMFDKDKENGYFAGDGVSTTYEPQYGRRPWFLLKGTAVSALYDIRDKISMIKATYKWRQNNIAEYNSQSFWMNFNLNGMSGNSFNPSFQLIPGEEYEGSFTTNIFIEQLNNQPEENKYIQVSSWASDAKLLEIFDIQLELPVVSNDSYIDIPLDWSPNQSMIQNLQSKSVKYLMYVGNSIK
ncbi:hypothetical protein [Fusobacterium sp.]|uniref:hypothetical protein n=1 Tax=Fusobacterium sp. TaxID=68766 RepID=UPI002904F964|nr:hypothetical protein [Fusobacterium sp.]MDU1912266.1 hypothetical protein [Fusobacterium sp.]